MLTGFVQYINQKCFRTRRKEYKGRSLSKGSKSQSSITTGDTGQSGVVVAPDSVPNLMHLR